MRTKIKCYSLFFLLFTLIGCSKHFTFSYLMQHPHVLKKEFERCQARQNLTTQAEEQCKIIADAAQNVVTILEKQQEDPEAFGESIIRLQMECADAKKILHDTKQLENSAKHDSASMNAKFQAKANCEEKREKIKILLAVVGINSPE